MSRIAVVWLALVALVGCGSTAAAGGARPVTPPPAASANASSAPLPTPAGKLRRAAVLQTISAGLGSFLQYVSFDVDHPVLRDHKFFGFRIAQLNGDGWKGIDLRPGDIVTSVNGFPIERPEQAMEAFESTAVASEVRVDYERAGEMRALRLAIIDE
jgi:type II secretory pathway component PulC